MNKLQSFFVLKFSSSRLKDSNFIITIDLPEAKSNGEIIRVGDSEILSIIRKITGKRFNPEELSSLEKNRNRIKKRTNSIENRELLSEIDGKIDDILFISHIVSVKFDNATHYEKMIADGFYINGKRFVRLLSGAGNLRRNTVFFIDESIESKVRTIMDNGRNRVKLNPAKFAAYSGLYASSGLKVNFPKFCVVNDYIANKDAFVNKISENSDVTQEEESIELNLFDGQGLISPSLANTWAWEIGLDYIPSSFIFRAPYAKGQLVTFNFHRLASEKKILQIRDIWGNLVNVSDVDLILSESQFKMHSGYSSLEHYLKACKSNELNFRVTRVSHPVPKSSTRANYMFLQVLSLSDEDIEGITKDTIEYFKDLLGGDVYKMILYLGKGIFSTMDGLKDGWFEKLDSVAQALVVNPELKSDPYVLDYFVRSLNRQILDSYLGKLILPGNFSPLVSDPYAQAESFLGLYPSGLLRDGQHYSAFWNNKGISKVAGGRSPLTHNSEMMVMDLVDGEEFREWYKYQQSSFIIPPFSIDTVRMADADFDGDLVFTTSSNEFINGKVDGLPIVYPKGTAKKEDVDENQLWKVDSAGFDSKVGLVTNVSSTFHCMRHEYPDGSPEAKELDKRLVLLRMYQGEAIDGAKHGGVTKLMPEKWLKWHKRQEFDCEEDFLFYNSLTADRRPAFCRWLYPNYKSTYEDELSIFNLESMARFGVPFEELLEREDRTSDENHLVENYYKHSFFIHNESTMNRISRHMVKRVSQVKHNARRSDFNYTLLLSDSFSQENIKEGLSKMQALLKEYNKMRHAMRHGESDRYKTVEGIISQIRRKAFSEISSNESELADLAIIVSYGVEPPTTKAFAWNVFGDGIVGNLLSKSTGKLKVPVLDEEGEVEYLYSKYSVTEVTL